MTNKIGLYRTGLQEVESRKAALLRELESARAEQASCIGAARMFEMFECQIRMQDRLIEAYRRLLAEAAVERMPEDASQDP